MSNPNSSINPFYEHFQSPLIWMDLEMSGLDPESAVILEIAVIITDNELNVLEEGPNIVISQPNSILDNMDEWNTKHHHASGLTQRVKGSHVFVSEAESQVLDFIKKYCKPEQSPLCGNTIAQDRKFLKKYMPEIEAFIHYRNIDVSTLKELAARWYPEEYSPPRKKGMHMALYDVRESIEELAYYKKDFFGPR